MTCRKASATPAWRASGGPAKWLLNLAMTVSRFRLNNFPSRSAAIERYSRIAEAVQSFDLAGDAGFQDTFAECMLFPEELADDPL
jgi:hypothetical protein